MTRIVVLVIAVVAMAAITLLVRGAEWFGEKSPARFSQVNEDSAESLPSIDATHIDAIEVRDGADVIRVKRSGSQWVIPERFNAPAQDQRLKQVLEAVADLDKAERVGSVAARHKTYGVDDEKAKVLTLSDAAGKPLVELVIGNQDTSGGRNFRNAGTFVRPVGQNTVFRHKNRLNHLMFAKIPQWLDVRMVAMEYKDANDLAGSANRIVLEFDDIELGAAPPLVPEPGEVPVAPEIINPTERRRVVLECTEKEVEAPPDPVGPSAPKPEAPKTQRVWKITEPEGQGDLELHSGIVDQLSRGLLTCRAEDIVGNDPENPKYGLEKPIVDVNITFKNGTSKRLRVGNGCETGSENPAMKSRYAQLSDSPYVVRIGEFTAKQWQKKPEDLKVPTPQAPPTRPEGQPKISLPPDPNKDGPKKDDPGK